jgi:hypothetical protein
VERATARILTHNASASEAADVVELRVRNAAIEAEIKALRDAVQELRQDRDAWRSQAERLLLVAPPRRASWWSWARPSKAAG